MSSEWKEGRLQDFALVNPKTAPLTAESPFITMSAVPAWGQWANPDTTKGTKGGMRAQGGDVVVARITPCLENGKIAKVPSDFGAVGGSTEFIVLRGNETILSEYLFLWASERATHAAAVNLMTGSTGRQRVSASDYGALSLLLPPIKEQRRIVDLLGSVDDAIAAADRQYAVSNRLLEEYLEAADFSKEKSLGELATMRSGPSWKAADESPDPVPGSEPVLGITNTPRGRELDLANQKYVSGMPGNTMRVTLNSIIMIRTNGNRNRIGNVYRPSPGIEGFAVSAFQILIEPTDPADAALLYWALEAPSIQRLISEAASGSTGLGNVAIGWLRQLQLPFPIGEDRHRFTDTCEALLGAVQAADDLAHRLRTLRTNLLSALLSGAHRIPETYDELMGADSMETVGA